MTSNGASLPMVPPQNLHLLPKEISHTYSQKPLLAATLPPAYDAISESPPNLAAHHSRCFGGAIPRKMATSNCTLLVALVHSLYFLELSESFFWQENRIRSHWQYSTTSTNPPSYSNSIHGIPSKWYIPPTIEDPQKRRICYRPNTFRHSSARRWF